MRNWEKEKRRKCRKGRKVRKDEVEGGGKIKVEVWGMAVEEK